MLAHNSKRQTDVKLVSELMDNKQTAWEQLYDSYAAMMYGSILNITGDEKMASDLLQQAFVELRNREMLLRMQASLCISLVKHCCNVTLKHLKMRGLSPPNDTLNRSCQLIHFFYFENMTLTEIAVRLAVPEWEVLKNLQTEFKDIRKCA